jgi:hypothetical protein
MGCENYSLSPYSASRPPKNSKNTLGFEPMMVWKLQSIIKIGLEDKI